MNNLQRFAVGFFGVMGLLELGDFWGNVTTVFNTATRQQSMEILGVSETAQYARLALLIPLTMGMAFTALRTAWSIFRHDGLAQRWGQICASLWGAYAIFIFITAFIAASMNGAFMLIALVYATFAWVAYYLSAKVHQP